MRYKIIGSGSLAKKLKSLRSRGKKVVFTNGCFDILHIGHIEYLKKAKKTGNILVIGLNSDSSVRLIKGRTRPVNNERDRAGMLAALYFVDYVTIFSEPTPERLIRRLRPDILIKGADWKIGEIAGGAFVKSYGGKVLRMPLVRGYSTSSLIKQIKRTVLDKR